MKWINFIIGIIFGVALWFITPPEGVDQKAWHLFAIFVATICCIVTKPFPMGAIALMGLLATLLTNTLTFTEAFSGYSSDVVWLVVLAFFIARGFIITGLGSRIAYIFMKYFGKKTLGLSYGLCLTELILAPAVPSITARAGGIIYPILLSLSRAFGSDPHNGTAAKLGTFLTLTAFQATCITSAMFLTAMAGNPLIAEIAGTSGINITWGNWALAAIVPGILSLIIVPYVIYKISPPIIKETPHARGFAEDKLKEMGKIKKNEWVMLGTFLLLLCLWIFGAEIDMKASVTALLGICILLVTNVLQWKDVLKEESAWDTLIWFATLLMMAGFLNKFGLTTWFSQFVVSNISGFSWIIAFSVLSILYYYSHYFFASNVAHIGAMYAAFLVVSIALGAPPLVAALVLGFFSNLYGGLTHYGCGPAPILFGSGYVPISTWWKVGFIISVVNIIIWLGIGALWWKAIGMW
ncbi:MAG: anion permease [Chlamydiales bacterium]|nr:anion permease [Chlamydiales bacterium]